MNLKHLNLVLHAIKKAKEPITNPQIREATGLKSSGISSLLQSLKYRKFVERGAGSSADNGATWIVTDTAPANITEDYPTRKFTKPRAPRKRKHDAQLIEPVTVQIPRASLKLLLKAAIASGSTEVEVQRAIMQAVERVL
jgi:hypothetical protein